jgi:hypothetical protein
MLLMAWYLLKCYKTEMKEWRSRVLLPRCRVYRLLLRIGAAAAVLRGVGGALAQLVVHQVLQRWDALAQQQYVHEQEQEQGQQQQHERNEIRLKRLSGIKIRIHVSKRFKRQPPLVAAILRRRHLPQQRLKHDPRLIQRRSIHHAPHQVRGGGSARHRHHPHARRF